MVNGSQEFVTAAAQSSHDTGLRQVPLLVFPDEYDLAVAGLELAGGRCSISEQSFLFEVTQLLLAINFQYAKRKDSCHRRFGTNRC